MFVTSDLFASNELQACRVQNKLMATVKLGHKNPRLLGLAASLRDKPSLFLYSQWGQGSQLTHSRACYVSWYRARPRSPRMPRAFLYHPCTNVRVATPSRWHKGRQVSTLSASLSYAHYTCTHLLRVVAHAVTLLPRRASSTHRHTYCDQIWPRRPAPPPPLATSS